MWELIKELLEKIKCKCSMTCSLNELDVELTEDDFIDFVIYAIEGETDLTRNRNEYTNNFSNLNI